MTPYKEKQIFINFSCSFRKNKSFCRIFTSKNGYLRIFRETGLKFNNLILFGVLKCTMIGSLLQGPQHTTFWWLNPYDCFKAGLRFKSYLPSIVKLLLVCFWACNDLENNLKLNYFVKYQNLEYNLKKYQGMYNVAFIEYLVLPS